MSAPKYEYQMPGGFTPQRNKLTMDAEIARRNAMPFWEKASYEPLLHPWLSRPKALKDGAGD